MTRRPGLPAILPCLLSAAAALSLTGCPVEYDFERETQTRGTLGEELHAIWLKDAARSPVNAEAKASMLETRRDAFVTSVDLVADPEELHALDGFLRKTMTLTDDGTLPGLTRKLSITLDDASQNTELARALSNASRPSPGDFMSPIAEPNLVGYLTAYPKLGELSKRTTRIVLDNDGFADDGTFKADEATGATEITRTLVHALNTVEPQVLEDNVPILIRDMLLREDQRFAPADPTRPIYVAKYDRRGYPVVGKTPGGQLISPFADMNGDGLADLDERGSFVLAGTSPLSLKPFERQGSAVQFTRDAFGRAKTEGGEFAFEYVDLNNTGLGFLVREYAGLAEKDVVSDLLLVLRRVMGNMMPQMDDQGPYQGFSNEHPIVDMLHALVHILAYADLPELMETSAKFFNEGSGAIAGVLVALEKAADISDKYPDAKLGDDQTIAYDLVSTLHEVSADPALWKDFMDALGDPITKRTGEAMVTLMSWKNTRAEVTPDGPYDACFYDCKDRHTQGTEQRYQCIRACPNKEIFKEPMDFSAPESPGNRSMLQAMWHLMWGLTGVPYAMSMDQLKVLGNDLPMLPPMIALDGGAEAYLRSVAGLLDLAEHVPPELFNSDLGPMLQFFGIDSSNVAGVVSLLSELFGVKLDRRPTHDQLTRMFAQKDIKFASDDNETVMDVAEPRDRDGYKLADNLADGLYEAEAAGLIDAVTPMARAFAKHNREDLLLRLFETVHLHYTANASLYKRIDGTNSTNKSSNLRSYEPIMKEVFEEGTLFEALFYLSTRIKTLEQARGFELNEQVRRLVHHATRPDGFKTRAGETFINLPDGRTEQDVTRLHVLIKAVDDLATRVKDDPEAKETLNRSVDHMLDLALKSEWPAGQDPRFVKEGSVALTVSLTQFLADHARKKRDRGELDAWFTEDVYATLRDFWSSRLLSGLVVIAESVLQDDGNRAALGEAIAYLVGTPRGREHTALMGYEIAVRAISVDVWVPLAREIGRALDPDREWAVEGPYARMAMLSQGALVLDKTLKLDEEEFGLKLIHQGVVRRSNEPSAFSTIFDVVADYWRVDPASTASYSADDYQLFSSRLSAWLLDEKHGMEQVYDIAAMRKK